MSANEPTYLLLKTLYYWQSAERYLRMSFGQSTTIYGFVWVQNKDNYGNHWKRIAEKFIFQISRC